MAATAIFIVSILTGALFVAPVLAIDEKEYPELTAEERKLGEKTEAEIEKHFRFIQNPLYQTRVEFIVNRLKPYMQRELPYKAHVIDHEMINAFAIAGGSMYVTTGMLDFVKTDLELAGVIAHEMVHADRKHVIIQMARNERMTLLAIIAAIASRGKGAALIATSALQVAVMGAYSIDIEKEADALGIDALLSAGYNPVGMLTLQERLLEENLKRPHIDLGIYQTHPDTEERISSAVKYMEEHNIAIDRKMSLGVLRPSVETEDGTSLLKLDGDTVWSGPGDDTTKDFFERVAHDLWKFLKLETAPYDIMVGDIKGRKSLIVEGKVVAREDELPSGVPPIDSLRENIQAVLTSARRAHPMADYFQ